MWTVTISLPPLPPRSRLLVPDMFKLSCSIPFTPFLRLVSVYQPFHLYFIAKTLSMIPLFSAPFLQLISVKPAILLYLSASQLFFIWFFLLSAVTFRPSMFAMRCIPCWGRMGSWWLRSPVGSNMLFWPRLLLDRWLGWPDPINRLVMLCPNFDY